VCLAETQAISDFALYKFFSKTSNCQLTAALEQETTDQAQKTARF
jgi:hypothetical protein